MLTFANIYFDIINYIVPLFFIIEHGIIFPAQTDKSDLIVGICETKFWQLHSVQIEAPPEGVASIDKSSQDRFRYIGTRNGT